MNAVLFLIKEHNRFRRVFSNIANAAHKDATKRKMLIELCRDLIRHEGMEQTIWYPKLINIKQLTPIIKHLISEEKSADKIIAKLLKIKTQTEWETTFIELKNDVEHHAHEEETKLFPKVQKLYTESELMTLGLEMHRFKKEYELLTLAA